MICPHIVNVSMMLGSILTWGFLWPYIDAKAGYWYPVGLKEHDFRGLFGYKVSVPQTMPDFAICKVVCGTRMSPLACSILLCISPRTLLLKGSPQASDHTPKP